jgi:hypothetical protein
MGNFFDQFDRQPSGVAPAPNAAPSAQSAPVGPMPANGLGPTWLEKSTEGSAAESNDALTQAQGGIESLQHLQRLRGLVAQAPDQAFGSFRGSNLASSMDQTIDALTGKMLPGSDLAAWHERLTGAYNDASLPMIKQLFGAVPRSPELQNKALEVLGGTRTSDKATALQLIDAAMADANDKINRGIGAGRVAPANVPQRLAPAPGAGIIQWERGPGGAPRPVSR